MRTKRKLIPSCIWVLSLLTLRSCLVLGKNKWTINEKNIQEMILSYNEFFQRKSKLFGNLQIFKLYNIN